MSIQPDFYTYLHARPQTVDATGVFYVGKGQRDRYRDFAHRTLHHKNIVAKHGVENLLIGRYECSNEATAHDLERGLIKLFRAMGVRLANYTDGGDGLSGFRHSENTKTKIGDAHRGRKYPPEFGQRVSVFMKGRPGTFIGKKHSVEAREKIAASKRGKPNLYAKHLSDPTIIARIRATKLAKPIVECLHCLTTGRQGGAMKRYHFDNCKNKGLPKVSRQEPRLSRIFKPKVPKLNAEEVRRRHSEASTKMWSDPEKRASLKLAMRDHWTPERKAALSYKNPSHDPLVNAKKSAVLKGRLQERVVCPHCGLEGGLSAMIRYHFDNCKHMRT